MNKLLLNRASFKRQFEQQPTEEIIFFKKLILQCMFELHSEKYYAKESNI